jgi:hypothetical protein
MDRCSHKETSPYRNQCPLDAVAGKTLCIFHLPADDPAKSGFWLHLASYLKALFDEAGNRETAAWRQQHPHHWVFAEADPGLVASYAAGIQPDSYWDFSGFTFPPMDEAHRFYGLVSGPADFRGATFAGPADFRVATFTGETDFGGTRFSGEADFSGATFAGKADFGDATFDSEANFAAATFSGEADFRGAMFPGPANFGDATFSGEADFRGATFDSEADLARTRIDGLFDCTSVRLRNRLSFSGTLIGDRATILLWGLNFVHGTSNIAMESGKLKGRIDELAGQVVFRDITRNIGRVSFLHTDIFADRLYVRFANVKWDPDPKRFLFDARFRADGHGISGAVAEAADGTRLAALRSLFGLETTPGGVQTRDADLARLIGLDIERIAREIRRATEAFGSYSDAGDYYAAEMEYRRCRRDSPWFEKAALFVYKHISGYGEKPARALGCLLGLLIIATAVYPCCGFRFPGHQPGSPELVRLFFGIDASNLGPTLGAFGKSFLFALTGLIPGILRPQEMGPTCWVTVLLMVLQAIFGASILALFLLAIRRRFSR